MRYAACTDARRVPQASFEWCVNTATTTPVSLWEKRRNFEIFKLQGNRNPFIDFPDWIKKIDFFKGFVQGRLFICNTIGISEREQAELLLREMGLSNIWVNKSLLDFYSDVNLVILHLLDEQFKTNKKKSFVVNGEENEEDDLSSDSGQDVQQREEVQQKLASHFSQGQSAADLRALGFGQVFRNHFLRMKILQLQQALPQPAQIQEEVQSARRFSSADICLSSDVFFSPDSVLFRSSNSSSTTPNSFSSHSSPLSFSSSPTSIPTPNNAFLAQPTIHSPLKISEPPPAVSTQSKHLVIPSRPTPIDFTSSATRSLNFGSQVNITSFKDVATLPSSIDQTSPQNASLLPTMNSSEQANYVLKFGSPMPMTPRGSTDRPMMSDRGLSVAIDLTEGEDEQKQQSIIVKNSLVSGARSLQPQASPTTLSHLVEHSIKSERSIALETPEFIPLVPSPFNRFRGKKQERVGPKTSARQIALGHKGKHTFRGGSQVPRKQNFRGRGKK